jgi:GLPGLI family protein
MRTLLIAIAFFFTLQVSAQNISGQAFYESKTTMDMDGFGGREMSEDMKKMIAQRMKSYLEKTYILTFNTTESIYKEEEKLEAGPGGGPFGMMMSSYSPGAQYKNLETNQLVEENEFFGKEFLVTDAVPQLEWVLTKESKQIGQYVAFKATAIKPVDPNDYSMARPKRRGDKEGKVGEDGKNVRKDGDGEISAGDKSEDPMDNIEIPEEVLVSAWYTPMIPVRNGPGEYAGLPGLILELSAYRTTLLCSKIIMNPKEIDNIEAPTKGKEVTRAEYQKIVKDKTDEMRENFRGRGSRGGRGGRG